MRTIVQSIANNDKRKTIHGNEQEWVTVPKYKIAHSDVNSGLYKNLRLSLLVPYAHFSLTTAQRCRSETEKNILEDLFC